MYKFHNKTKDSLYFIWRLVSPVLDPLKVLRGIYNYPSFLKDLLVYKLRNNSETVRIGNLYPQLHDKVPATPFIKHYFYQELWCFEKILEIKPAEHVDIGSTYQMSGYISKLVKTTFIDIRPIDVNLKNLSVIDSDITNLPYGDGELESISCLHVIEHIGLGRYGDPLDVEGSVKAIKELQRVLKKGGRLYISTPVGKSRLCFNAHRIFSPDYVISQFDQLLLLSFGVVNDCGNFSEDVKIPEWVKDQDYACGMFCFTK